MAKCEGEDENLQSWIVGHIRYFTKEGQSMGYEFSQDMLVLFEEFEVIY